MTTIKRIREVIEYDVEVDEYDNTYGDFSDVDHDTVTSIFKEVIETRHEIDYSIDLNKERGLWQLEAKDETGKRKPVFSDRSHDECVAQWARLTGNTVDWTKTGIQNSGPLLFDDRIDKEKTWVIRNM